MALDIETKVENNGTTDAGKLTADEFNELVDAVNDNTTNITSVTATVNTNVTDISQIANGTVMPFDGFVSGKSYTAGSGSNYESIWYDKKQQLFLALYGSTYYSQWGSGKTNFELYNDDDHLIEDKAYLYNGQIYVWDDEEETLVVAKPEVINNLTSSDTDVALSAYQGKVLNNAISELEETADANASDIDALQTSVKTNTTNIATNANDIDALETTVATNTTNIATNASDIETLQTSVATNTANIATNASDIETLQTSVKTNTTNIATNASDIDALEETVNAIESVPDDDIESLFE